MIGMFDSGSGGVNVLRLTRQRLPRSNIILLTDRANAPYGTKSREELTEITERNVAFLRGRGADIILIACCTASTLIDEIDLSLGSGVISTIPLAARAAEKATRNGRVAVIATEYTVASHAFSNAINARVTELSAQPLVGLIDEGESDNRVTQKGQDTIRRLLSPLSKTGSDTLVLGCTHFSALRARLYDEAARFGIRRIVDSAEAAADGLFRALGGRDEGLGLTERLTT